MSFDALAWAAKQAPGTSGSKLVLLGLAECAHRRTNLAFPSLAELVEFTALDRKSVIANLDKLQDAGFITDTGRRVGRTGQIKVYELALEREPKTEPSQNRNSSDISAKSTENGTRNLSEPPLPSEAKASSEEKSRKRAPSSAIDIPDWVPEEPFSAFLAMRAKKKKPVSAYIAKQLLGRLRTIADAGWNLDDVINKATINFNDGFWMPDGKDPNMRRANGPARSADERRDAQLATADKFEKMGRLDDAAEIRKRWGAQPIGNLVRQAAKSIQADAA